MIGKKYNEILKKLDGKIENKKDLIIARAALADLSICYIDEITKVVDNFSSKVSNFETRLSYLERNYSETQVEEIHLTEKISCPYCNFEFSVEYDDTNHEITCPKCNNLIELDWGEFEDDM